MQIIFTWFFSFWLSSGSSLLTSNPKVAWATLLLLTSKFSSSDLQIFLLLTSKFWKKKLLQFFTSPNTCYPHTLCQLSSQTCFCTLLLNNILHITFSAFHWSWIYLWMKTQQKSLKKSHCGFWPVAGPGVCAPTDHYDGTGAIPRGGPARPDAHQPLQPQRW